MSPIIPEKAKCEQNEFIRDALDAGASQERGRIVKLNRLDNYYTQWSYRVPVIKRETGHVVIRSKLFSVTNHQNPAPIVTPVLYHRFVLV